jgi:hypothetical protein
MKAWILAAAVLGIAPGAWAGGFAPVGMVATVPAPIVAPEPTPLEWLRHVGPQVGRDVVVPVAGGQIRTIEWHRDVTVRVRTESGAPLTHAEQAAVRDLALVCRRGEARGGVERVEPNGTYVIDYDCAWIQGSQ